MEQGEIEQKVGVMASLDKEVRNAKQGAASPGYSSASWKPSRMGGHHEADRCACSAPSRIHGSGMDLGLFKLRPIWLMSPDVASRVLPLKAGLFDLVIYDEASQMPVEQAIPTLFRARHIVVAGDEKQMPPSSFFAIKVDGDDDDEDALTGELR